MHSHDHAHGHSHDHDGSNFRIGIAFVLNFCFTIVEFIGGWLTNSTAIMADAVHDLGDTLSIGTAWMLGWLGRRPADHDGALVNGLVLVGGSVWVLSEAIPRLADPVMPATCRVPDDQIAYRSYPLLAARELLQPFIREQVHGHQAA